MGRYSATWFYLTFILSADVVAVVDDNLCAMYEVTGSFPFYQGSAFIIKVFSCYGISVQSRQRGVFLLFVCTYSVFVLGIDEATTDTRLHIDEVKLDDTGNVAPVFLIESQVGALYFLREQLQIYTGGQCHLVQTDTVVALAVVAEASLPVVVGGTAERFGSDIRTAIRISCGSTLVSCLVSIVGSANILSRHEVYVAGQRT